MGPFDLGLSGRNGFTDEAGVGVGDGRTFGFLPFRRE